MRHSTHAFVAAFTVAIATTSAACVRTGESAETTDSTAVGYTDSARRADSIRMAGSIMRTPARDADHEFLRNMIDHHEALIQVATTAEVRSTMAAVQTDANKVRTKQTEDQQRLIKLAQTTYGDSVQPMLTETGRSTSDSLQVVAGAGFDNAFYSTVIAHHRAGLRMIDEMMPRLMNAEVKKVATKMKSDQQREIAALEKKTK